MNERVLIPGEASVEAAIQRVIQSGLSGEGAERLLSTFAAAAGSVGIPLTRLNVGSDVLDPVLQARNMTWRPQRFEVSEYARVSARRSEEWLTSPVRYLLEGNSETLSFALPSPEAERFPITKQFLAEGFTGYHAIRLRFGQDQRMGGIEGVLVSVCTAQPGGFSEAQIDRLNRMFPAFGLAFLSLLKTDSAVRALQTYLGATPAKRVLTGNITRGEPDALNAIIWFSDIVAFTRTTEGLPQEAVIEFLNCHAEVAVEAVERHGGEVLKFIGDGLLAVFTGGPDAIGMADQALEAALDMEERLSSCRAGRRRIGLLTGEIAVSLHVGEVHYGNFGSQRRLDFTVLGAAVNESSRINALGRTLDQNLLASDAFVDRLLLHRERMISVGRYALRGIGAPQHLYTVERPQR